MLKRFRKAQEKLEKKVSKNTSAPAQQPIPCQLIARAQWDQQSLDSNEKRLGTYHGSFFPGVPQLWIKNWMVVTDIKVDFEAYESQGYTREQILQGCINYLNLAPPRKKYAKKQTKPLYGKLKLHKICKIRDGSRTGFIDYGQTKKQVFLGRGCKTLSDKPKKPQMFLFGEKKAENLIYEALINEKLSSFLMKNYETGDETTDAVLFAKLCEFFMCNRALYEAITGIELEKEKKYNEADGSFGYVIDQIEAKLCKWSCPPRML
jgi:hypothetical protein